MIDDLAKCSIFNVICLLLQFASCLCVPATAEQDWCRHRAVQNAELSVAVPVLKPLNPVRIRPPPAYAYRPPPNRTGPSSRRPECRSSRAVHGCACLEIIKPCLQSTASYLCVLVTTLEDGAVIEPSRMPFESSCPSLRLSWN